MFDNGGWRAGVMHRDPMYLNLAIALGRRSPDGDVLVSAISADGFTTELIGESQAWDRPLRIPVDAARALHDALAQHFGGTTSSKHLRADYDAERARVDKLTDAVLKIATREA